MLCRDCELFRFPYLNNNNNNNDSASAKTSKSRSTRLASALSAEEVPVNTASAASRTRNSIVLFKPMRVRLMRVMCPVFVRLKALCIFLANQRR